LIRGGNRFSEKIMPKQKGVVHALNGGADR